MYKGSTALKRPNAKNEIKKIIDCSNKNLGSSVFECPECHDFIFVGHTCKSRLCSSCGYKYKNERVENITQTAYSCRHRHIVFTMDKTLWINKQVQSLDNYSSSYFVCNLKTASSNRILTMCDALYDDLKKYYGEVSKFKNFSDDFFIFGNDKGLTPLTYKQAQRRKGEIANKAGVKEIRLHDFRHSCASFLVNNGAPVTMVSKYLGHSNSSETLNTYSHLFNTTSSEVINTINRARNIVEN